jgi:hypothetical protein
MNADSGFRDSFHGFLDYSLCFPEQEVIWGVVGIGIFVGTWISIIPQYYLIVSHRSAYGLDSVTLFVMVFGQFTLVANIVALHASDFVGVFQYPFGTTIWRLWTFINASANWLSYLPCAFLSLIFFDSHPRPRRGEEQIAKEKTINLWLTIAGPIPCFILLIIHWSIGPKYGFEGKQVLLLGRVFGILAAVLWIWQYLPQIWTTCKLKSPGNLSIVNLAIQAPGSMINAIFMFVGQGDDWTTAVSSFLLSIEQFVLLIICIYFNIKNGQCKCSCSGKSAPVASGDGSKPEEEERSSVSHFSDGSKREEDERSGIKASSVGEDGQPQP